MVSNVVRENIRQRHRKVIDLIKGTGIAPKDILELGSGNYPLLDGSDTMDKSPAGNPVFLHDIRRMPWPVARRYKMILALQVFEHLGECQARVFEEMKKTADHAIITVPYMWNNTKTKSLIDSHCRIGEAQIVYWTGNYPAVLTKLIRFKNGGGDVLLKGFCFSGEKGCLLNDSGNR